MFSLSCLTKPYLHELKVDGTQPEKFTVIV